MSSPPCRTVTRQSDHTVQQVAGCTGALGCSHGHGRLSSNSTLLPHSIYGMRACTLLLPVAYHSFLCMHELLVMQHSAGLLVSCSRMVTTMHM